jgi:hypothetical protein
MNENFHPGRRDRYCCRVFDEHTRRTESSKATGAQILSKLVGLEFIDQTYFYKLHERSRRVTSKRTSKWRIEKDRFVSNEAVMKATARLTRFDTNGAPVFLPVLSSTPRAILSP